MTRDPVAHALELMSQAIKAVEALTGTALVVAPKQPPNNRKKLSARDVADIRELYAAGSGVSELADAYDVHHATISRTVRGIYHKGRR